MNYKIIIAVVALVVAFIGGRYSVPQPEIKAEVAKIIDKDVKESTVTITKKDGTVKTVTKKDTSIKSNTTTKVETTTPSDKVHIQALYGYNLTPVDQDRHAYYGLAVSKKLIGPITGGVFMLIDGRSLPVGGLTLGVEL